MRRAGFVMLMVLVSLSVAMPVRADSWAVDPTAHTLSTKELWQYAVRVSDVVLLGRIMAPVGKVDTLPSPDPKGDPDGTLNPRYSVPVQIEPIEYLKGGLEGDVIEARYPFWRNTGGRMLWDVTVLAGVDTVGAIFFLVRNGHDWELPWLTLRHPAKGPPSSDPALEAELRHGFVWLPQRRWLETVDQVRAWMQEMPADSAGSKKH